VDSIAMIGHSHALLLLGVGSIASIGLWSHLTHPVCLIIWAQHFIIAPKLSSQFLASYLSHLWPLFVNVMCTIHGFGGVCMCYGNSTSWVMTISMINLGNHSSCFLIIFGNSYFSANLPAYANHLWWIMLIW
jgi:hypothetical protein